MFYSYTRDTCYFSNLSCLYTHLTKGSFSFPNSHFMWLFVIETTWRWWLNQYKLPCRHQETKESAQSLNWITHQQLREKYRFCYYKVSAIFFIASAMENVTKVTNYYLAQSNQMDLLLSFHHFSLHKGLFKQNFLHHVFSLSSTF